ncbi:hypothetical protein FHR75_002431 [Kineococcus radiotolerans]|uniref:Integral membrane protein TerC n=2 Tax=Kineococcus radiotolerans TaxID=131568 RepID=A6WD85_KINRD|nr:DUF475 domain-containing protein [Kineococcus radiotolerans]ABS04774.1 protein of unknown function DUF475 [Kineococcus radiotolerans SRS30216 = ATCC BAA-149]MBB2901616.1 hypothetical protein [Kineococcus radiotolerans]
MILKTYRWSFVVTALGLVLAAWYGLSAHLGIGQAIALVLILSILEISLSFDNAVVNATILERMSDFWRKIFLSVGIIIAVFGMRLVFPIVLVSVTAGLGPIEVIRLALEGGDPETPGTYGYELHEAHPTIASFGGMFLLMLFLNFIFGEKEHHWLGPIERALEKVGKLDYVQVIVAGAVLLVVAETFATEHGRTVLASGLAGIVTYLLVNGLGELFNVEDHVEHEDPATTSAGTTASGVNGPSGAARATGKAAFFLFLYLEVLDASFSFDGVIGAFAITSDPVIIAIGLGVGAMYIRSMTVHLVEEGTLAQYPYLENGALWAIGALAVILLLSIEVEIPEVVTGLIGLAFIVASLISSIRYNRAHPEEAHVEQHHAAQPG